MLRLLRRVMPGALVLAAVSALPGLSATDHAGAQTASAPVFGAAQKLAGADGGTEPRATVAPDGSHYVITNSSGTAIVYVSRDGGSTWTKTPGVPAGQSTPTIDVDIVATSTGRLVANELDGSGLNFPTSYSDDGGATWIASTGFAKLADQDRNWLAAGPVDPTTHQSRVYLLFHNLASGTATHNMFVETSTDGGASFGPPVPTTLPGSQAWFDLQCADSGGPSSLSVNQATGQVYAFFGTRSSALGGCGASVTGSFEINVVGATRVWVATSPDGSLGSWTQSLAVDDAVAGNIVGMQLSPGALDRAGNVYVAYPESPKPYPDYDDAAIRVRWAPPDMSRWSAPITIAPTGAPGNILAHIVAGDPGKFDVAYFAGSARSGKSPVWYETVAQVLDGMSPSPTVVTQRLSNVPAYSGSASAMMGACGSGPAAGVENGFACTRSTDVWGVALDRACRLTVSWPSVAVASSATLGAEVDATWVATQTGGSALCSSPVSGTGAAVAGTTAAAAGGLANTARPRVGPAVGVGVALLLLPALLWGRSRRRGRAG